MLKVASIAAVLTGLVSLAGGLHGGLGPAKSVPSLAAGGVAGLLLLLGGWLAGQGRSWALILVLVVAVALAGRFLPAWLRDRENVWPALVMASLGAVTAILALLALIGRRS